MIRRVGVLRHYVTIAMVRPRVVARGDGFREGPENNKVIQELIAQLCASRTEIE
jgi:hypothetical protein